MNILLLTILCTCFGFSDLYIITLLTERRCIIRCFSYSHSMPVFKPTIRNKGEKLHKFYCVSYLSSILILLVRPPIVIIIVGQRNQILHHCTLSYIFFVIYCKLLFSFL